MRLNGEILSIGMERYMLETLAQGRKADELVLGNVDDLSNLTDIGLMLLITTFYWTQPIPHMSRKTIGSGEDLHPLFVGCSKYLAEIDERKPKNDFSAQT